MLNAYAILGDKADLVDTISQFRSKDTLSEFIKAGQGNPAIGPNRSWGGSLLGRIVAFDVPRGPPSDSPHPGV